MTLRVYAKLLENSGRSDAFCHSVSTMQEKCTSEAKDSWGKGVSAQGEGAFENGEGSNSPSLLGAQRRSAFPGS